MIDDDPVHAMYEQSYRQLVAHFTALSGSRSEAEDVVQEAFLVGVAHPHDFAESADSEAWLRAVALTLLRRRWRRTALARRVRRWRPTEPSIDLGPGVPEE